MGRKPKDKTETSKPGTLPLTSEPSTDRASDAAPNSDERKAFVDRNQSDAGPKKDRVSFALNEDGIIDVDSLRSANKQKVKELFSDPRNRVALGIGAEAEADGFQFTEESVRETINGLAKVNAFATSFVLRRFKKFSIDPDILAECYTFNEKQMAELVPRGTRLANKYAPEWLRKYQDEIFFLMLYFKYTSEQAMRAITLQAMRNQQRAQQKTAAAGQPARPNGGAATIIPQTAE